MSKFDVMKIDGHAAVVSFGPDVEIFRGEFIKPRGKVFHFALRVHYAVDVVGNIVAQNGFVDAAALLPVSLERLIASSPSANVGFE